MILVFEKRVDKTLDFLKGRAECLGETKVVWCGDICSVSIKAGPSACALVRKLFRGKRHERNQFEKKILLECINHAEQLALAELYSSPHRPCK